MPPGDLVSLEDDPLWYKDALIYELHVKAFWDSNDDGIGDFPGLTQKLDYLQDLGITAVWLLPFCESPLKDDGYDISGYVDVHPAYGTVHDFKAFLREAHRRGIRVITELVLNHTSDQHPWFQAARRAKPGSPRRDFYVWSDHPDRYREARVIFKDFESSNWAWDPVAKAYYWHRFYSHQPDLNFDHPPAREAMLRVIDFWVSLGVDGLRLDAVPYLFEREGTNCENLPETHGFLKKLRGELDSRFKSRMLLAEANQWPEDAAAYFGSGDECQMAFHFPLMPRLFMALHMEDRFPVLDILEQTPPIPENCQWGLFLRNHDELTLEMVTDEERDYMYRVYAQNPQMRVNLGIRRRLAPLLGNHRRRIELMNGLLFSLPGTPILYYGDEIGMGDNIYLGDRNGVRTPMQWTGDRNAGFSRANPARLYSPPIMDPVYGYEAVNVEAQQSDSSSLLHWMRNMIALRKLFRVFGRGSLEFLEAENRKVLAYVRKYGDEQVLCVANLSRFAQPVELDLSTMAGMTPVEMLGFTEFPTIGKTPYLLTLGPYAFYWFELQGTPKPVDVTTPEAVPVTIRADAEELFGGRLRRYLETALLPAFLRKQRWFGSKSIQTARVADWMWIRRDETPAAFVLVEVAFPDGGTVLYDVPLGITFDGDAERLRKEAPDSVVCEVLLANRPGLLHDALASDAICRSLLSSAETGGRTPGQAGAAEVTCWVARDGSEKDPATAAVARVSTGQGSAALVFGGTLMLKLPWRVEPGPDPDLEICSYLTREKRFEGVPTPAAAIEYTPRAGERSTLAILQQLVPNQGDAWTVTLDELGRYYEHSVTLRISPDELEAPRDVAPFDLSSQEPPQAVRDNLGLSLDSAAALGRRTAQLHAALAAPTDDPAFQPLPLTRDALREMSSAGRARAASVFAALKTALSSLPDEIVDSAALVLAQRGRIVARFSALEQIEPKVECIRIHGDYRLSHVLSVKNDFLILDFGGEPSQPPAERRRKRPALEDVAAMLGSLSDAALTALLAFSARRPEEFSRLEQWAEFWERWTAAAFLRAWRETAADSPVVPGSPTHLRILLEAFQLDQALDELDRELRNRPARARLPLHRILTVVR